MTKLNTQKTVSLVVASISTIVGVALVVMPMVPAEWKAGITAAVGILNYLMLSPIAKLFGVPSDTLPKAE